MREVLEALLLRNITDQEVNPKRIEIPERILNGPRTNDDVTALDSTRADHKPRGSLSIIKTVGIRASALCGLNLKAPADLRRRYYAV